MYRVVRAGVLYYENNMRECKGRYELIKPLMLLVDTLRFEEARKELAVEYLNLCDIIGKIKSLYLTGEGKYHHFGMLVEELEILGFNVKSITAPNITDADTLKDQVDLLLQFLAFRYPIEEYDNRTGVHDAETNEFIFVQP